MAVKIRLQRHGKKGKPFYHIVAADGRAKRDGRFIEKIGIYNPNTNPATIDLQIDRAVNWLQNGAVPTDTARAILSYKGALYKNHLLNGVRKGAFDEKEAEKRFNAWLTEKEAKIAAKAEAVEKGIKAKRDEQLAAEKAQNAEKAKEVAAKNSELAAEAAAAEEVVEEVAEEAPSAEAEATEAPAEEVVEETPAKEAEEAPAKEEEAPKAEAAPEAKEEEKAEEAPKAEAEAPASEEAEEKASEEEE